MDLQQPQARSFVGVKPARKNRRHGYRANQSSAWDSSRTLIFDRCLRSAITKNGALLTCRKRSRNKTPPLNWRLIAAREAEGPQGLYAIRKNAIRAGGVIAPETNGNRSLR
jgi:hypothetical protein